MSTIQERLSKIIGEQFGLAPEDVAPSKDIVDDLGADSLDSVELIMEIEHEFGIEIPDEDAERMNTVQDILDYLDKIDAKASTTVSL